MTYWKQLSRKVHYKSDWLTLTLDRVELPDGRLLENFELMHYSHNVVGAVAVNQAREILLVRAYRYLRESFDWEIPGGIAEHEENLMAACRRELEEETGYSAGLLTPLLSFFPHKATCDQQFHLYLAEDLSPTGRDFQREEITEAAFFPVEEVKKMIDRGEINDGMSLVGLQKYILRYHRNHG